MKKKFIWIGIVAILVIAGAISGIVYAVNRSKEQTAAEWMDRQSYYVDSLQTFADSTDNVFTLYLAGDISQDDFLNHISSLKKELSIMKAVYQQETQKHPIKLGTETYATKKGTESVAHIFEIYDSVLESAEKNAGSPKVVAYQYLAYRQDLVSTLADYTAAKIIFDKTKD